ncbi:MAG TPA: hypothetical protein VFA51_09520 [Candidatus Udaeobacter sp.]|nr:hypothetical protein [Candidatus Udaeobacter sp.]
MDTNKDTQPRILLQGYEVIIENCDDAEQARALVQQRIGQIEQVLTDMKAEKTLFNRQKHILTKWLSKQASGDLD